MRHGAHRKGENVDSDSSIHGDYKTIRGEELGCYFCSDVTAPGNVSN